MPHAMPRKGGKSRDHSTIKKDPESLTTSSSADDQAVEMVNGPSFGSQHTAPHTIRAVDESFHPQQRSQAPTLSEGRVDPEPLLRELRVRPSMAPPPVTVPEESFFHSSFQDIGKRLKECNDTLGELQQLNLGVSHDVQLPELVLVGDQSAGKSSLMSGLAALDLPRSEGTCTRCPLHIRVSRYSEWSCRVSLRKQYSYEPPANRSILESDVTPANPFFPWRKKPLAVIQEFKTMHDNNEIETVLKWAQIAILNDDKHPSLFVPGSGAIAVNTSHERASADTIAKFSPNIVALEIKGPDLPDLSFYDMPGIFQNPADVNDNYLVRVVRNLSKEYIRHPSAIIMCSMPMNSDAENSSTLGLIRDLGATPRTIGVLTKADLLPPEGNHDQWLAIMRGNAHRTGLGYFITSRPQGKDLDELKAWEERLFVDHGVDNWPSQLHDFEDRCGVEKLKSRLSERLGEDFAKSLPTIKSKVRHRLTEITHQLDSLPELPSNVELEVQTCLGNFAENSRKKMDDFIRIIGSLPRDFCNCLVEIKPKFILKTKSDSPVVEISDDESDATSISASQNTPTAKRRQGSLFVTPTNPKRQRIGLFQNGAGPSNSPVKAEDSMGNTQRQPGTHSPAPRAKLPHPFTSFSNYGSKFRTLEEVRAEIQSKMRAGIPALIPVDVYEDLALAAIAKWKDPIEAFLTQTTMLLQRELEETLRSSLEKLEKRRIYTEAKRHLSKCLEEHRVETEDALTRMFQIERERLLTFNDDTFKRYVKEEEQLLLRFRHHMRMQANNSGPAQPLAPWEKLTQDQQAQDNKQREAEKSKLGPDPFEQEVKVVAYVRGYYLLAAHRFGDSVAQRIICYMMPAIRRKLSLNHIGIELGVVGPNVQDVYARLMTEDANIASTREALKIEKERFAQALRSIETLESGAGREASSFATETLSFYQGGYGTDGVDSQSTNGAALDEA